MTPIECVPVEKEEYYRMIIKRINNILLIVMILFAAWYYLPSNQQLRGRDTCSYTAIRLNETCYCYTMAAVRTFYSNGSMEILKLSNKINNIPLGLNFTNVAIGYS